MRLTQKINGPPVEPEGGRRPAWLIPVLTGVNLIVRICHLLYDIYKDLSN